MHLVYQIHYLNIHIIKVNNLKYNKFNIHNNLWLGTEILVTSVSARTSTNTHFTTKVLMPLTKSQTFQICFFISKVMIMLSELRKIKGGTNNFKYIYFYNFITKMFCESTVK